METLYIKLNGFHFALSVCPEKKKLYLRILTLEEKYKIASCRDARTPQPGEIVFNTMRYRSSETVHRLGYFQSTACKD